MTLGLFGVGGNPIINESLAKQGRKAIDKLAGQMAEQATQQEGGIKAIADTVMQLENAQTAVGDFTKAIEGVQQSSSTQPSAQELFGQLFNQLVPEAQASKQTNSLTERKPLVAPGQQVNQPSQPSQPSQTSQQQLKQEPQSQSRNVLQDILQGFALGGLGATSPAALQFISDREQTNQKAGLKPSDIFSKFEADSKDFISIRDSFDRMTSSLTNPQGELDFENIPVADLDLLFSTAKTLDPSGRVTDSDIAIQQSITGAFGDDLRRIGQKLKRKGVLIPEERKMLYEAAKKRFLSAERQQQKSTNEFVALAEINNIDPSMVIRDIGLARQQAVQQGGSPFIQTPGGNSYRMVR